MLHGDVVLRELIAVAMVAGACGPEVVASGGETSTGGSANESNPTGASSSGSSSGATVDTSTGEPVPACDPAFASELAAGEIVWTFEAPAVGETAYGTAVALDADGRVFAAGSLEADGTQGGADGWLHALAVDGTPIWEARYTGTSGFDDWFTDVAITPSGDIVIVGTETLENGGVAAASRQVVIALAYDAAGSERWQFTVGPMDDRELSDAPPAVTTDANRILVGATSIEDADTYQLAFAELDHDGQLTQRWDHVDPAVDRMQLADIRFDAHGAALVLAGGFAADALWLGQLDADLSEVVGFVEHAESRISPVSLEPLEDGALVLATIDTMSASPFARRPLLQRYDAAGAMLWSETLGFEGEESVQANDMTVDCAGRIAVLATRADAEPWIVRLDADGNAIDRASDGVGEIGFRWGITSDPGGNVVVTGRGTASTSDETFVVRKLAGAYSE